MSFGFIVLSIVLSTRRTCPIFFLLRTTKMKTLHNKFRKAIRISMTRQTADEKKKQRCNQ